MNIKHNLVPIIQQTEDFYFIVSELIKPKPKELPESSPIPHSGCLGLKNILGTDVTQLPEYNSSQEWLKYEWLKSRNSHE